MLLFENPGELDITAMTTFGVNVKDNSSAIGFFGTGLKYAIAIVLRLEGKIWINSGRDHYEFKLYEREVRGKKFQVVGFDHVSQLGVRTERELGFTTELGKTWAPWMALREVWCNTADEKGFVKHVPHEEVGKLGGLQFPLLYVDTNITRVFIECAELESAYHERDQYFLEPSEAMKRLPLADIVRREPSNHVFYRGIRAYTADKAYAWTWSISRQLDLSEDRTIKKIYSAENAIMASVLNCNDEELIAEFFMLPKDSAEHSIHFTDSFTSNEHRAVAEAAMTRTYRTYGGNWHPSIKNYYFDMMKRKEQVDIKPLAMTGVQASSIEKALDFLQRMGVSARRYPLVVTDDLPPDTLGLARGNTIYINVTALNMGVKQVAGTIYEEYLHLHNGFRDESREFQNYLIDQVMTMAERLTGEPL